MKSLAIKKLRSWQPIWTSTKLMKRGSLITVAVIVTVGFGQVEAYQQPTFRTGVDLVRVAAVVRDHKGHFVQDLNAKDFEVLEGGQQRPITDFRRDTSNVSV